MITGIILASGFSRRMGRDKLLIDIKGKKIIERVIIACTHSNLDKVILIYRREEIKKIANRHKVKAIENKNAYMGQSESVKIGIRNTDEESSYMFLVGDQPFIDARIINKLIKEHKDSKLTITVPYYKGRRGMPLILSNIYREELLRISGDKGGRDIIKRYSQIINIVNINDERLGIDIDSNEDLGRLKGLL